MSLVASFLIFENSGVGYRLGRAAASSSSYAFSTLSSSSPLRQGKRCQSSGSSSCYHCQYFLNVPTTTKFTFHSPLAQRRRRGDLTTNFSSLSSSSSETKPPSSSSPLSPPYDPFKLFDGTIPYPKSLSPSSASEFRACPQSYLFQYLYGIREPPNAAMVKGSFCHKALEQLFDLHPHQRTLENLQNLFRKEWSEKRLTEEYSHLFEIEEQDGVDDEGEITTTRARDEQAEREWGKESLQLLANYMQLEDPKHIPRPNPLEREMWVNAQLTVNPKKGVTGYTSKHGNYFNDDNDDDDDNDDTFLVRGIVDRIDMIRIPPNHDTSSNNNTVVLRIVDYKSGKAPNFKYSPSTNERIAHDNFWQLKIYALLVKEMIATGKGPINLRSGLELRMLRLLYLTSVDENVGVYLDMDLGESEEDRDEVLQEVHEDLSNIWRDIVRLVDGQDPKAFVHCDRKFCSCHKLRPEFVKGTVWERQSP